MIIEINNLTYRYSTRKEDALSSIFACIEKQEFVSIIGHTGSGKSTLIQNLNALLIPTSGSVTVEEYVIKSNTKIKNIKELRRKVGIVFQFPEYQLFEETIKKDILFGPKNFGIEASDKLASDMLKVVGLDDSFLEKSPFDLSGGEKRKVAIAGILAFNPDVLIVDEPTAGLDPKSANDMMQLFKRLNESGKTIILVTHQMNHVLEYSTRVLALNHSKLVYDGTPINLFNNLELVNNLELDIPDVILLRNKIANKYPDILSKKITNVSDFVDAYLEVSHDSR